MADCRAHGFVVIYRWEVIPSQHDAFREQWRSSTTTLRDKGALGSCLTLADDGDFVAIALWPSEDARKVAFESLQSQSLLPGVTRKGEARLQVTDDLWANSPLNAICK